MPRMRNRFLLLAAVVSFLAMLTGCGGGGSVVAPAPVPPVEMDAKVALAGAPANHGLAPMEEFTVQPGTTEEHGNVDVSCPAGGPACVVSVADDGAVEYEVAGGMPSLMSVVLETNEIESVLSGLRSDSTSPALARFSADPPPPDVVTCAALLLGCEGGLGPIHYRAVGKFDFSGFLFTGRRRGVSLAERTQVSGGGDTTNYRALAGWLDHSFFLLKTPGIRVAPEEIWVPSYYYGAYSVGNSIDSNPDVLAGGAATWTGIMVGIRIAEPDGFVKGDATITVSNPQGNPDLRVDVEFRNMKDELSGADFDDVSWEGLALEDGSFGVVPVSDGEADASRHPARRGISGRFYGPNHEEVGGLFSFTTSVPENDRIGGDIHDVSGVFGARRD
ncbi:MAG: hypothetical protein OXL41_11250 [Nitrospinae bacterium]|nr:hypothetical protein [Nitrospinota bacterium]